VFEEANLLGLPVIEFLWVINIPRIRWLLRLMIVGASLV